MASTINYIKLLSACFSAAQQSAHVIVDTLAAGQNQSILNKTNGEYDPQTIADIGAQHIIQTGLGVTFPGIEIVGEEPQSEIEKYLATFSEVPQIPVLDQHLFTTTAQPLTYLDNNANSDPKSFPTISTAFLPPILENLDITRLIIYIDPLDGTSEYTKGHKEHVTTLISITFDGTAIGGVLYYPFTGDAVFGGLGLGCYSTHSLKLRPATITTQYQAIANHPVLRLTCAQWLSDMKSASDAIKPVEGDGMWTQTHRIVTSKSHLSEDIFLYFRQINVDFESEVLSLGGAGNKGAQVLKGTAEAYLYPVSGTKRWDIGVLEGLLFAHGGSLTDIHGDLYRYDHNDKNNNRGCICTLGVPHENYIVAKPAQL